MTISDQQLQQHIASGEAPAAALASELLALRNAIREHQNQSGHALCWLNDRALWRQVDPEAQYPHASLPVREEFLGQCARYYESRLTGTPYEEPAARKTLGIL